MTGSEIDHDVVVPAEAPDEATAADDVEAPAAPDGPVVEAAPVEPETAGSDQQELQAKATQLEGDLDGVDTALKRLDDGTYSTCESCGETLSDDQLVADPTRRTCIDGCATR